MAKSGERKSKNGVCPSGGKVISSAAERQVGAGRTRDLSLGRGRNIDCQEENLVANKKKGKRGI